MSDSGRALNWNPTEPCQFCGHLHPYVVCAVCGCLRHHPPVGFDPSPVQSINPTEIVQGRLFLGDNSNASRVDHLRTLGITRTLNMSSPRETVFQGELASAMEVINQCEREGQSVLVYCMTGRRSAAIVIGFLMKRMGWTLVQSYHYVRGRRPSVNIEGGAYSCLLLYQQIIIMCQYIIMASNNNFPLRTAATSSLLNVRGVRPNVFISGAGQANQAYFIANRANPNAASSSRIVASNYNFQPTTAPTTSFRNAGGVPQNYSFRNCLEAYVRANPANSNAAGSSRIVPSNSGFLPTTAPTTSFPSRVPPNELITEAGQEASFMTGQAAGSSRNLRSSFRAVFLGTGDRASSSVPPNPNAATHSFGNAEGVPSPTSSTGSSNSTVDSSPPIK